MCVLLLFQVLQEPGELLLPPESQAFSADEGLGTMMFPQKCPQTNRGESREGPEGDIGSSCSSDPD